MSQIEQIKAEIERLQKEQYCYGTLIDNVANAALEKVTSFIERITQKK